MHERLKSWIIIIIILYQWRNQVHAIKRAIKMIANQTCKLHVLSIENFLVIETFHFFFFFLFFPSRSCSWQIIVQMIGASQWHGNG